MSRESTDSVADEHPHFRKIAIHALALPSCSVGVIVKSGVLPIDSSGGLIDVGHFDSIVEFHSSNHLGQIIESS